MCMEHSKNPYMPEQAVLSNWRLDTAAIKPVGNGISSNACLVTANDTKYILRNLSNRQQGYMEYKIASAMSVIGISPRIIPTCSGDPFAEIDGNYYNLQEYSNGKQLKACNESLIQQVAKTVALMHKAMGTLVDDFDTTDRFSLLTLFENSTWRNLQDTLLAQDVGIEKFKAFCLSLVHLDQEKQQWIHGDLGTWNLLLDSGGIKVIDFGECRKGSIYFDAAAIITSLLSSVKDQAECSEYIFLFLQSYAEHNVELNYDLLSKYIKLWFVRGILANITDGNYTKGKSERAIDFFWNQMNKFA